MRSSDSTLTHRRIRTAPADSPGRVRRTRIAATRACDEGRIQTTRTTIYVGYRPRPEDRCPQCEGIDADARVHQRRCIRVSLGIREPEAWDLDVELRCRKDGAVWGTTWTFAPSEDIPGESTRSTAIGRPRGAANEMAVAGMRDGSRAVAVAGSDGRPHEGATKGRPSFRPEPGRCAPLGFRGNEEHPWHDGLETRSRAEQLGLARDSAHPQSPEGPLIEGGPSIPEGGASVLGPNSWRHRASVWR